jgi:hypothetical protein
VPAGAAVVDAVTFAVVVAPVVAGAAVVDEPFVEEGGFAASDPHADTTSAPTSRAP